MDEKQREAWKSVSVASPAPAAPLARGHGPSEAARELFGGLYDDDDPVAKICREARAPAPASLPGKDSPEPEKNATSTDGRLFLPERKV